MTEQMSPNDRAVIGVFLALHVVTVLSRSASLAATEPVIVAEIVSVVTRDLLERNVTACDGRSCRGRFSERKQWSSDDTVIHSCYCDKDCGTFSDCCLDSLDTYSHPREDITCMPLRSPVGVYVVSQCPDGWPQDETRQRCEMHDVFADDPVSGLPVTSLHTRMTYRNAACAQCHADVSDAVLWPASVECPGLRPGQEGREVASTLRRNNAGAWGVTLIEAGEERFHRCSVSVELPHNLHDIVRTCLPMVSDCAENGNGPQATALCRMYTAIAYDSGRSRDIAEEVDHLYKNPHCAICNGVAAENITCDWNSYDEEETIEPAFLSFVLNITNSKSDNSSKRADICPGTSLWDPFLHKCRDLFCEAGRSMVGDICTPDAALINFKSSFTYGSVFNDVNKRLRVIPCTKYVIFADEFEKMDDGSVYVIIYDRHYSPDQYEYVGNNIAVCSKLVGFSNLSDTPSIISVIFVFASIVCLCCHLVVFSLMPKLRNLPGKNLASLCVTLLVAYVCCLASPLPEIGSRSCRALAIAIYTAFTASFLWTNVMAFDVFTTLRYEITEARCRICLI